MDSADNSNIKDLVWYTAVEWVIRERGLLTSDDQREMIDWLNRNPAHRAAYEEASCLWLLSGLASLPSSHSASDEIVTSPRLFSAK